MSESLVERARELRKRMFDVCEKYRQSPKERAIAERDIAFLDDLIDTLSIGVPCPAFFVEGGKTVHCLSGRGHSGNCFFPRPHERQMDGSGELEGEREEMASHERRTLAIAQMALEFVKMGFSSIDSVERARSLMREAEKHE